MNPMFLRLVSCALCGGVFLAELFHVHGCAWPECRADKHVHQEAPRESQQSPQVLRVSAYAATTSSVA
jgi:hypothetical protein